MIAGTAALTLRAAGPDDEAFLAQVYASTRAGEMAAVPWSDDERRAFIAMQHRAQHTDYHGCYPDASFDLVMVGAQAVGRLYLHRGEREHRIIDIALLPPFRGQGIGTRLLDGVLAGAQAAGVPVRLHVEAGNPAAALYRRLGFVEVPAPEDETGFEIYHEMEWLPRIGLEGSR
jgi:ribosomal protein S18 acetylase RimI-like enzyme